MRHVQREFGKIIAGGKPSKHSYRYVIKPGTPLYRRERDEQAYKRWLWSSMNDESGSAEVLYELYVIINGAWVGCDVYVEGPFASGVVAAAGYLMNQYTGEQMPLVERRKKTPATA